MIPSINGGSLFRIELYFSFPNREKQNTFPTQGKCHSFGVVCICLLMCALCIVALFLIIGLHTWTIIKLVFQPLVVFNFTNLKYQTMDAVLFMLIFIVACWIVSGVTYKMKVKK
jgi:hypothetical protein